MTHACSAKGAPSGVIKPTNGYRWGVDPPEDPVAPIQLTVQRPDFDTIHVTVQGSLDLARAYEFDEAMRRIERDAPGRVLLDLRGLEFLDTTGLSRLVALRRRCRRTGRRLVLVRGSQAVQRLFAVTAMNEHFEVVRDPAELLATA
jgi:anti-sigma B factor antagonist